MFEGLLEACLDSISAHRLRRAHSVELIEHRVGPGREASAIVLDGGKQLAVHVLMAGGGIRISCSCNPETACEHVYALAKALATSVTATPARPRGRASASARAAGSDATAAPADTAQPTPEPAPKQPPDWRVRMGRAMQSEHRDPTAKPMKSLPHYVLDVARGKQGELRCHAMVHKRRAGREVLVALPQGTDILGLPPVDRIALQSLHAANGRRYYQQNVATIDGSMAAHVLPALFATGRVVAAPAVRAEVSAFVMLRLDTGAPWTFVPRLLRDSTTIAFTGELHRDGETLRHEDVQFCTESVALAGDRLLPVDLGRLGPAARSLLNGGPMQAPIADELEFLGAVANVTGRAGVPDLFRTRPAGAPLPVLMLRMDQVVQSHVFAELAFEYGDRRVGWDDELLLTPPDADGTYAVRERAREGAWLERALTAGNGDVVPTPMPGCLLIRQRALRESIDRLLREGFRVLAGDRPVRQAERLSVTVSSAIDWFDVRGNVEFGGGQRVPLPQAVAMLQKGERLIELGDGSMAMLPEAWLQRWSRILDLGDDAPAGDAVRMHRSQALLLDLLLAERAEVAATTDAGFVAARARLEKFSTIAPKAEPRGFAGTLRPYQQLGLGWLLFLRDTGLHGCLADDMGLGKTVQVLALLQHVHGKVGKPRGKRPSLLVAPRSLLDNWRRETARFAPELRVLDFSTGDRWQRLQDAGGMAAFDLVLTTYGTMRLDAERMDRDELQFEYAILDEAQAIANQVSLTNKAARLLRAEHRLALTGTPVQNHIGELWALFDFLAPGMLGRSKAFRRLIESSDDRGHGIELPLLHRAMAPFLLRRTKDEVLTDLPPKQEQELWCDLEGSQAQRYAQLREHYRNRLLQGDGKLDNTERFVVLEALLRLRQAACHEGLVDPAHKDDEAAKLETLLPMLQEIAASGHKALVFSQFTELLAIVKQRLAAIGMRYEYLDGKTTKRQTIVDRFQQDSECPVFLVSLKAGGVGLNLTAADYVFLLDPWWNPAAESQAIDRTHRIGQTRKVTAYRLIARGTVEEKVLALQQEKRALVDAVLGGDKSLLAQLTREDLAALLG